MFLKIFFSFLSYLLFIWLALASDKPEITWISYTGNLSKDTIIDVKWTNLEKCNNLIIWDKDIKIENKTNTNIKYNFSDSMLYSWVLYLDCENIKINRFFDFPYINTINWFKESNFDGSLTINWQWFWKSPRVSVDWKNFSINYSSDRMILWKIPSDILNTKISVESWWLKSNIIDLWIKIPKINFIIWDKWIKAWEDIKIYWENFNNYWIFKIYLWEDIIYNWKSNQSNQTSIKIPNNSIWDYEIWIENNYFISPKIKINISWERPIINKVEEKNVIVWSKEEKQLQISWINFTDNKNNVEVFINSKKANIKEISGSTIILSSYNLIPQENLIEVSINNNFSPIYLFSKPNINLPNVWWFDVYPKDWNKREFRLYLNNFNKETDDIYLSWRKQNVVSCFTNMCRIEINSNVFKWYFTAWRNDIINPNRVEFDIGYENLPFITNINFNWEITRWTKVTITWWNFDWANITQSNFFRVIDSKLDITQSNNTIIWSLPTNFDPSKKSNITITLDWQKASFDFLWNDILDKRNISWPAIIKSLTPVWWEKFFKEWSSVFVEWKWFKSGDIVNIWNFKTQLLTNENNKFYFIIPNIWTYWNLKVSLINKDEQKSNEIEIIIVKADFKNEIIFNYKNLDDTSFLTDDINSFKKPLYSFWVFNPLEDFILKEISFFEIGRASCRERV